MEANGKDRKFHKVLERGAEEQLAAIWRELVQWYSRLSMTFHSDKPPALSGLAQKFSQKRPGAKYLAGLWDKSLVADLVWINPDGIYAGREGDWEPHYLACPSWSWAVTSNRVVFSTSSYYFAKNDTERKAHFVKTYFTDINA
jgi:hypothetical protein